ncbi:type A2 lantipeptide [Streptomyces botrytidirepellens]|uniref:Type A2 lantipeptide n=1 Tax=Streptomyces botrytidirepellens TaxID=2486417 RepID=A0A3M8W0N1_9ACTN|nr:type A2 lantipeptide [Streptomyces botrytidirepellens]RNG23554.1 type A2 lantipeptide [Streptomyces botrytidirepellens]
MSYNAQIETREISDADLDGVAAGAAGLALQGGYPGHLEGIGGAELAGHSVIVDGAANLQSGQAGLNVTAA